MSGNAIKVSCGYTLSPHQQRPNLYCFGPPKAGKDGELVVEWTGGAVQVTRCWNDCASKKQVLFTARRLIPKS